MIIGLNSLCNSIICHLNILIIHFTKKEDTYKVYLNSITKIDDEKIEKYKRETIIRKIIYTDQSILRNYKNKDIFKIEYFDSPILSKTFTESNITVLIDKSKEKNRICISYSYKS